MTTAALSALPSSLASLLSSYGGKAPAEAHATSATPIPAPAAVTGGALGSDPAYTLSLGQKDSSSALVGYTKLAKLGGQFESGMAALATPAAAASLGSIAVEVQQLAKPQTLLSGAFGDSDFVSLGTGTLTIQTGSVGPDGLFAAKDGGTGITIQTGTLEDVAASINAAQAGITAAVVEEGGGYALQVTGNAGGAGQAFRIQGLSELAFDPAHPNSSMLTESQQAQDSVYSIDGTDYSFGANTKVPVGFGLTADFTATGTMSVTRQPQAEGIQSLVTAFNGIQHSIVQMAGKNGELAKDANLAAGMFKSLNAAATGHYDTGGKFTSLAQVGISVQADGTLAVDQTALTEAVGGNPTDLQALISAVSVAMDKAMTPYLGSHGSIASQADILAKQLTKGSSLLDYLDGTTTGTAGHKSLLDYLNASSNGTASEFGQNGNANTTQLSQRLSASG